MVIPRKVTSSLAAVAAAGGLLLGSASGAQAATPATPLVQNASNTQVATVSSNSGVSDLTVAQYQVSAFAPGAVVEKNTAAGALVASAGVAAPALTAATSSCWTYTDWRRGNNIFGAELWRLNLQVNWCQTGGYITSANSNTWASTSFPGWSYKGLTQQYQRNGVGWNQWEVVRQGHFCFVSYFSCVQDTYPYMDLIVAAGGQVLHN